MNLAFHPDVLAAGSAGLLYLRSVGAGFVKPASLKGYCIGLGGAKTHAKLVRKLVEIGLWVRLEGAWMVRELDVEEEIEQVDEPPPEVAPVVPKKIAKPSTARVQRYRERLKQENETQNETHVTPDETRYRNGVSSVTETMGDKGGSSSLPQEAEYLKRTESLETKDVKESEDSEAQRQEAQRVLVINAQASKNPAQNGAENEQKPKRKPREIASVIDAKRIQLPAQLDNETVREKIDEWIAHKRRKRKPFADVTGVMYALKPYLDGPAAVLIGAVEHSIGNNYEGLFAPRGQSLFKEKDPDDPRGNMALRERLLAQGDDWG